ncbi:MAG: GDSL-type esterase/lipase family protein, partial [Deltaproteobacteria bacterium]|nr:GDSL-type esterase/lipase family protein [Deltaproteobacteria bacterium]
ENAGGMAGMQPMGGSTATGGISATGGNPAAGGNRATGGNPATGGRPATGGIPALGGTSGQMIRVQPLGDSITQGKRHPDEATYRRPLWKKLMAAGYKVDFVGSTNQQLDGAHYYDDYDPNHEGHYGWKITDVLPMLDGWLKGYTPDISLIHLGTNDQGSNNPALMVENIGKIVDKLRAKNPRVTIIVAKLIEPSNVGRQFGDLLPAFATQKGTADSPIIVVDQDAGFVSSDTRDGIHPNPSGQEKMAVKWFDALVKILPAP